MCGGEQSCGDGAVKKAENSLDLARQAEELLKIKERNATELLQKVSKTEKERNGVTHGEKREMVLYMQKKRKYQFKNCFVCK